MAASVTMRKRQLAQALAEKTGAKLKTSQAIVEFVFDEIAKAMVKGTRVNIQDFGIFVKAQRKARMGRNPQTGEPIKIKASVKPRFTPSKALKEAMAAKKYDAHYDEDALESALEGGAKKKTTKKK